MSIIEFGLLIFIGLSIFAVFEAYYYILKYHRDHMEVIKMKTNSKKILINQIRG